MFEESDEAYFEAEMNESGTCLTIRIYTGNAEGIDIEALADTLRAFAEQLTSGEFEVATVGDPTNH